MPKTKSKNIAKASAAKFQCSLAINKALPEQFLSVQRSQGNGFFTLRTAKGKDVRGTPRGLFTAGTMRISVGQIVVVEGDHKIGVEIVGVVADPRVSREARDLVRAGKMPAEVLAMATSAGAVCEAPSSDLDDLFEAPAAGDCLEQAGARGGMKAQRAMAAADAAIAVRVATLLAGGGGTNAVAVDVVVDLDDL
jgi:hypothetical protein